MGESSAPPNSQETGGAAPLLEISTPERDVAQIPLLDDEKSDGRVWERPRHEWKVRLAILLFAGLIFLPNLGAFGLWDPWETHYGAVTTNMVETYDWVSPWWGYKEQIGTEPRQGNHFFSKPIFIFWSEATFCRLIGRGEWAIRAPMALLAILTVFFIYLVVGKIWTRRLGVLVAVIMATAPQFYMISRQAQTDMPFVGTLTIALGFFMLALFGPRQRMAARGFWIRTALTGIFLLLNTIPQYLLISTDLTAELPDGVSGLAAFGWALGHEGWAQSIIYALMLVAVLVWYTIDLWRDIKRNGLTDDIKDKWIRRWCLVLFYVMAAQSTYAKGLLGFFLPGAIILIYLAISRTWKSLSRVELINVRGLIVFICVGFPWYVAMFAKHGAAYWQRFFIHDHFNRLGAGVHQIDSGTFEHFIKWLGIGMYPWAIFVPLALIAALRFNPRDMSRESQGKLFVALWFAISFALFTLAATKFHHYIFPALPALTILTALFLDKLIDNRGWLVRFTFVVAVFFFAALSWDLHQDPQHLRNLMTYKYDRPLPEHLPIDPAASVAKGSETVWQDSTFWRHSSPFLLSLLTTEAFRYHIWIKVMAALGLLALLLFLATKTRKVGLVALGLTASMLAMWSLNYYMPSLSPHWSQKYLFDSYYDSCHIEENPPEVQEAYTPILANIGLESVADYFRYHNKRVCKEDVISWLITWRGETYYSYNELQPITKEEPQFGPYLEERNHGEKFYALMERGKMQGFKSKLESYTGKLRRKKLAGWTDIRSWDVRIINDESRYFQMVMATPVRSGSSAPPRR